MRPKVIAGNWKMHHGPSATRKFFSEFSPRLSSAELTILIFPPAISLLAAPGRVEGGASGDQPWNPEYPLGAQGCVYGRTLGRNGVGGRCPVRSCRTL